MNMSKISKAIAGGVTGAVMGAGGTGSIVITLPPGVGPGWLGPVCGAIVGFIVGFVGVYFAPANAAPS